MVFLWKSFTKRGRFWPLLRVSICAQDLEGVAISINKWWKIRYPEYKIRIVSKKEFELVKMQAEKKEQ